MEKSGGDDAFSRRRYGAAIGLRMLLRKKHRTSLVLPEHLDD
jgi:hypothetical protein